MKIKTDPWQVPNFIRVGDNFAVHIRDANEHDLAEQCDRFRADVFEKAGKQDPAEGAMDEN